MIFLGNKYVFQKTFNKSKTNGKCDFVPYF